MFIFRSCRYEGSLVPFLALTEVLCFASQLLMATKDRLFRGKMADIVEGSSTGKQSWAEQAGTWRLGTPA